MTVDCFFWNNDSGFIKRFRVCWFRERGTKEGSEEMLEEEKKMETREGERKGLKGNEKKAIKKEERVQS